MTSQALASLQDDVIATANHAPDLSDQMMLVEVLEKLLRWVDLRKQESESLEHTQASGGLRTALRAERQLLGSMMKRNLLLGKAVDDLQRGVAYAEVLNALP